MNLAHIELSQLVISSANMRAKRKNRDITDLIPSVRARGVLVPILVRPNGTPDTYEIVAGRRRYFAAKAVQESTGKPMTLPCAVIEPGDDAAAIEASLIENIARLDPDDIMQWETFARLVKEGRSVENIAATFGLPKAAVRRVLALGNLLPRILNLYRTEKLDPGTIRSLTLATTAQQRAWLAIHDAENGYAPTGRALKAWLFGGDAIPTSSALFNLEGYTAPVVTDLFEDHSYFSDSAQFWTLQNRAIEERKQAYLAEGWSEVVVLDGGRWFERWAYEARPKQNGGRVYIVVGQGGAVEIHEGFLPRKESARSDRGDQPATPARPELTAPLKRYVDLHRHAVMRTALLGHPWLALRLMLAHAISGSALWKVSAERQYADKAETRSSIKTCPAESAFMAARQDMLLKLGLGSSDAPLTRQELSLAELLPKVMALSDDDVLSLGALVMGETLDANGQVIEPLGTMLGVEMPRAWVADEAFLSLVRDRAVLLAIVSEVAGAQVAEANREVSTKVLKGILRDCFAGLNDRTKVEAWAPRWMCFPSSRYLSAGDEQTIEAGTNTVPDADTDADSEETTVASKELVDEIDQAGP